MYRILEVVYKEVGAFIDDIGIEGLKIDYDREEAAPGIWQFVKEHIINVDKVLLEIECVGAMISTEKTQWYILGVKIVGYVYDLEG